MFICFDTEDNSAELMAAGKSGFDKQVTQIAAMSKCGRKYHNRGNVKQFLAWLRKQPERYVYAHNLQYDLGNLFADVLDSLDLTMVGGRLIKAVWGNKVFVDSFNIWPMSAKKLGAAFGLEKMEMNVRSKRYVFRDVEIIHAAMSFAWAFAAEHDIDKLPNTLGGLCLAIWKHYGGVNCHDSNEASKEAYYGGRVELFKVVNDCPDIAYTDINSLYPSVMTQEFPGHLQQWTEKRLPRFGIIRCRVKVPKMDICPLPYRDNDGRILFPWGTFEGTWTVAEINALLARGGKILKRFDCWGTDEASRPYKQFVETVYAKRLKSKSDAEKLFYKLLMNNLYGRLGTGGVIGRTVLQTWDNQDFGVCYGNKVLVKYQMPLGVEVNWAHAAYVTAYGRLRLLHFMEQIGAGAMIYCDTDSTIFDCPGKKLPFKVSTELGEMKLESWEESCQTYAPKAYRVGDKWKAKGVPVRLAKQFLTKGRVDFDLPFKLREAISFYDRNNSKKLSVWRHVAKFKHSKYDKKQRRKNRFFPLKVSPK